MTSNRNNIQTLTVKNALAVSKKLKVCASVEGWKTI